MQVNIQFANVERIDKMLRSRAINLTGGPKTVVVYAEGQRNRTIAAVQAERWARNPWYLSRSEYRAVVARMAEGLRRELGRRAGSLQLALWDVGDMLIDAVRSHIDAGRSAGKPPVGAPVERVGAMPKLSKAYAKRKVAQFGAGLPVLVATGELYGSLRRRVVQV